MRTTKRALTALLAAVLGAAVSSCGSSAGVTNAAGTPTTSVRAASSARLLDQPWLLRFNTAGGSDGELVNAIYVHYTPSSGAITIRRLPGLTSSDTYSGSQALMVSADQKYALLDSAVARADRVAGRLTLYPTGSGKNRVLNLRALTGVSDLRPAGAAFDPDQGQLLRVVDTARRVWLVDPVAGTASRAGDLPRRSGWIYANGFDKNTGLPYIEDINTTATLPAGNGDDDVRPVERRGGEIWTNVGSDKTETPALPCGFGSGFDAGDGTRWMFCADTPRIAAYRLAKGAKKWEQVGQPSKDFIPATAEELPVVLPPV